MDDEIATLALIGVLVGVLILGLVFVSVRRWLMFKALEKS